MLRSPTACNLDETHKPIDFFAYVTWISPDNFGQIGEPVRKTKMNDKHDIASQANGGYLAELEIIVNSRTRCQMLMSADQKSVRPLTH